MFNSKKFIGAAAAVLAMTMSLSSVAYADETQTEEEPEVTTVTDTTEKNCENTNCKEHNNCVSFFDPMAMQNHFMEQCKHFVEEAADKEGITVDELLAQKKDEADARRLEVLTQQAEEQGITVDELIANIQAQKEAQIQQCKKHDNKRQDKPQAEDPEVTEETPVTTVVSEDVDPEFTAADTTAKKHQRPEFTKPAEPEVTEVTSEVAAEEETTEASEETQQTKPVKNQTRNDQNKGSRRNFR